MADWYQWQGPDLILSCRLQPKASADELIDIGCKAFEDEFDDLSDALQIIGYTTTN